MILPTIPENGNRYDVLDGALYVTPSPGACAHDGASVISINNLDTPSIGRTKIRRCE